MNQVCALWNNGKISVQQMLIYLYFSKALACDVPLVCSNNWTWFLWRIPGNKAVKYAYKFKLKSELLIDSFCAVLWKVLEDENKFIIENVVQTLDDSCATDVWSDIYLANETKDIRFFRSPISRQGFPMECFPCSKKVIFGSKEYR